MCGLTTIPGVHLRQPGNSCSFTSSPVFRATRGLLALFFLVEFLHIFAHIQEMLDFEGVMCYQLEEDLTVGSLLRGCLPMCKWAVDRPTDSTVVDQ